MATFNKLFVTDKTLEKEGVWHTIGAGVKIKVARVGTPEYNATLRRLAAPHKRVAQMVLDGGELPADEDMQTFKDIEAQALAKHCLVDWEGFTETDDAGSPSVPYSEEKALEYIKGSDDFRKLLIELATKMGNFKRATQGN